MMLPLTAVGLAALAIILPFGAQEQTITAELAAIAEEACIYGFPDGCKVLDEYDLDRSSGQFKAPFNQISIPHRKDRNTGSLETMSRKTRGEPQ
jgi:hypothetical protein